MNKIGWILGMALLLIAGLISCEKEALDGEITIRFSLGDGAYGTDETRGTGLGERDLEAETVVVPVEGVLHMYATLEEESTLRAAGDEVMEIGTKIIIAAYNDVGTYVTEAEYEVTNTTGGIKPTDGSGRGLIITTTGDYTFVAYSLNTTSTFSYSNPMGPYSANNAGDDPLLGASAKVTVSAGMNRIKIEMRHVFSRVKVRALTTELTNAPNITALSAVLVGYKAVIEDGEPGKGAAEEQAFNFATLNASDIMSDQRVVYAGQEDVTVIKIVSATIGGTTHAGSVARFNQKLLPGRSYTLRIKFDELEWAGSNIFWDGNRLWFYPAGNTTNQGYQGVFFKFGSLVGISPVGPFSTGTTVYVAGETGASSGYTWDEIRYWDGNGDVGDPDTETLTGDICRYINWGYRLPKRSEFGSAGTWQPTEGWEKGSNGFVGQTTSEAAGTDNMLAVANRNYAKNVSMGGVTMPASGYRSLTGELGAVGLNGVYWTGTFFNEGDGRYLHFDTEKFAPGAAAGRGCAFSVRCVKN